MPNVGGGRHKTREETGMVPTSENTITVVINIKETRKKTQSFVTNAWKRKGERVENNTKKVAGDKERDAGFKAWGCLTLLGKLEEINLKDFQNYNK